MTKFYEEVTKTLKQQVYCGDDDESNDDDDKKNN